MPGLLGSLVHSCLEVFVDTVYVKGATEFNTLAYLLSLMEEKYPEFFPEGDQGGSWKATAKMLLTNWHERTDMTGREVIGIEKKLNFSIPVAHNGQEVLIPFVGFIDRLDRKGDGVYRVVDYKTQYEFWKAEDLEHNIQALIYAISIMLDYPDAKEVWVEMDLLRYSIVGRMFTAKELRAAYQRLQAICQRMADMDAASAPETLNKDCQYCVKLLTCKTAKRNIDAGGILSMTPDQIRQELANAEFLKKGMEAKIDKLREAVLTQFLTEQETAFDLPGAKLGLKVGKQRAVRHEAIPDIVGQAIYNEYASPQKMGVTALDKLMKDKRLSDKQREQLESLIYMDIKDPTVEVKQKAEL